MSAAPMHLHRWTEAEHLAFERASDAKHDYYNGQIYDLVGASYRHNLIAANAHFALRAALGECACVVLQSDQRVKLQRAYVYPDVVVVCGEPQLADQDTLLNPIAIAEVPSPATEAHDRGMKWEGYQRLESLRDCLLIAQDAPRVDHFARQGERQWLLTVHEGLTAVAPLLGLNIQLPLAAIYANVAFPEIEGSA
jgi:Uma2 family endonuclease